MTHRRAAPNRVRSVMSRGPTIEEVEYCDEHVCVCPPAYLQNNSKLHFRLSSNFYARRGPLAPLRYVIYFRFMNDVVFAYWRCSALSRKLAGRRCYCKSMERTDRQTDGRTDARPLHTPCSAYDAGSKNTVHHTKTQNFRGIRKKTFNDTQLNNRT